MQESGRNILRPVIMRSTAVSGLSFVHGHNLCSPENWWKKISIQRREKEREKGEEIAMLHEARSFPSLFSNDSNEIIIIVSLCW